VLRTGHQSKTSPHHYRCTGRYFRSEETLPDLRSFWLRNFRHTFFKKSDIFRFRAEIFLAEMKAQRDESGGRILLGDNTSGDVAILLLIRFLCAGVWISTGLPSMCVRVCVCVCGGGVISTKYKVPPRYEFITAVFIKMHVFRHITPSRLVNINVLENHSASIFKVKPSNLAYNSKFRRH